MFNLNELQSTKVGEKSCLIYEVKDIEAIDRVEIEMVKNNEIDGVLPFADSRNNDDITLTYDIHQKMSVSQYLGGIVRWDDLYEIVLGVAETIHNSAMYMIDSAHFVLERGFVYVDMETRKPQLVLAPFQGELVSGKTWKEFFQNLLDEITYDPRENMENLGVLKTYVFDADITIAEFIEKIKVMGTPEGAAQVVAAQQVEKPVVETPQKPEPSVAPSVKPQAGEQEEYVPMFKRDPVVEEKNVEIPDFNVPNANIPVVNQKAESDYLDKNTGASKNGLFGDLFGKKKTKEPKKTEDKKVNKSVPKPEKKEKVKPNKKATGFDIPGQKPNNAGFNVPGMSTPVKDIKAAPITPAVQEVAATMLDEEEEVFAPYIVEKSTGRKISIESKNFKLGREPGTVDYVVSNPKVGRFHATIVLDMENRKAYIRDVNSKNGTFVDGKKIQSNINVELQEGVIFSLAREEYIYRTKE